MHTDQSRNKFVLSSVKFLLPARVFCRERTQRTHRETVLSLRSLCSFPAILPLAPSPRLAREQKIKFKAESGPRISPAGATRKERAKSRLRNRRRCLERQNSVADIGIGFESVQNRTPESAAAFGESQNRCRCRNPFLERQKRIASVGIGI
jgi:hypothetical protein